MFIKLAFWQSNIVCNGILSLLILEANSLASDSDTYVKMFVLNMCDCKNSKNIPLIYLIPAAVTYGGYHSQLDQKC